MNRVDPEGEHTTNRRRVGLVGCVKVKAVSARPARDLYLSTLFSGRRAYVERSCDEWWILSADHGLVSPDEVLAPYDVTLKTAGRQERRRWSAGVLTALAEHLRPTNGDVLEIHAGAEYRDFGLIDGLRAWGCTVDIPTEGMGIGRQLQFYKLAQERKT